MTGKRATHAEKEKSQSGIWAVRSSLAELCDLVQEWFPPGDDYVVACMVYRMFATGQARFVNPGVAAELWPAQRIGDDSRPVTRKRAA